MRLLLLALVLTVLAFSLGVSAQTISPPPTRTGSPRAFEAGFNGNLPVPPLPGSDIGLRDCLCGEQWRFQGTLPQPPPSGAMTLELWVGVTSATACQASASRGAVAGTARTCFQVDPSRVSLNPYSPNFDFTIPVGYLIPPADGAQTTTDGTCRIPQAGEANDIYLSFVYTNPSNDQNVPVTYQMHYNFADPMQPTSVSAVAEEGSAKVSWSYGVTDDSGLPASAPNVLGFWILQDPPPAPGTISLPEGGVCNVSLSQTDVSSVATDASDVVLAPDAIVEAGISDAALGEGGGMDAGLDAGLDAAAVDGGGGGGTCETTAPPNIDPNDEPTFQRYLASELIRAGSVTTAEIQPLVNNSTYRFAVVVEDLAGNRTLSTWTSCVKPEPVTDFWEHYKQRGGRAEPGFCSIRLGHFGRGAGAWSSLAALIAAGLVHRRRGQRSATSVRRRAR